MYDDVTRLSCARHSTEWTCYLEEASESGFGSTVESVVVDDITVDDAIVDVTGTDIDFELSTTNECRIVRSENGRRLECNEMESETTSEYRRSSVPL